MSMNNAPKKSSIAIVSACMTREGSPTFAQTEVAVTQEEADNGIHYYLAEAQLLEEGYEEPFVHFDESESPAFLHPAVQQLLDKSSTVNGSVLPTFSEKS
jgi:hypothetical protein